VRAWTRRGFLINEESRQYPSRPFLGVGALIFEEGKILLVERAKEPLKGYWSIPGGIVETGEKLKEAVRREVMEETGLDVDPYLMFEIFERIMPDETSKPEYHYVLIDYLCHRVAGDAAPATDVSRVEWVTEQNLRNYRLTEGTLGVIERAFAKLQR
jgi:8-oxo-dGTP diphosphatase